MRNMCLGITAIVVTVGMVSADAQGRNFSGTWIIDGEKTRAAAEAAMVESARATGGTITAAGSSGVPVVAGEVRAVGGGGRARGTGSGEGTAAGAGGGVAAGGLATATGGGAVRAARGGGGGGAGVPTDMVITMDGSTFTLDQSGFQTSYPTNGTEVTIATRGGSAKAKASWKGDMLVIEQTIDSANGPVSSTTSWFLEGDSLVRLTTRRTYFKRK